MPCGAKFFPQREHRTCLTAVFLELFVYINLNNNKMGNSQKSAPTWAAVLCLGFSEWLQFNADWKIVAKLFTKHLKVMNFLPHFTREAAVILVFVLLNLFKVVACPPRSFNQLVVLMSAVPATTLLSIHYSFSFALAFDS